MSGRLGNERGGLLVLIMVSALLAAIMSFSVLELAIAQAKRARFHRLRGSARYAAEAGIVWAQQRLLQNPAYCGTPDPPPFGTITVDVGVTNCGGGNPHAISAKVTY